MRTRRRLRVRQLARGAMALPPGGRPHDRRRQRRRLASGEATGTVRGPELLAGCDQRAVELGERYDDASRPGLAVAADVALKVYYD